MFFLNKLLTCSKYEDEIEDAYMSNVDEVQTLLFGNRITVLEDGRRSVIELCPFDSSELLVINSDVYWACTKWYTSGLDFIPLLEYWFEVPRSLATLIGWALIEQVNESVLPKSPFEIQKDGSSWELSLNLGGGHFSNESLQLFP